MSDKAERREKPQVVGFVGLGLDNKDGETRLTRSEHFFLLGGSRETHERMQDAAVKFGESLENRGKRLEEMSPEEAVELFFETRE